MSDIDDFKSYLESHQAAFAAWGRFVAEEIQNQLSNVISPVNVPKQAEREVAKSMALMETTDDLFSRTLAILKEANQPQEELLPQLSQLYQEEIGLVPEVDKKNQYDFSRNISIQH